MSDCAKRQDEYSREIDDIDLRIAPLVARRDELRKRMPKGYDCCGEGEVYFKYLGSDRGEEVYHVIGRLK